MIGTTYALRGEPVVVVCQWRTPRKADNADLALRFPLVLTGRRAPSGTKLTGAPRNVAVRRPHGSITITLSRPLRRVRSGSYSVGSHVICPWPWCVCGYALGVAPGEVVGLEGDDLVVKLDLSGCSTHREGRDEGFVGRLPVDLEGGCHMDQAVVFTVAEIDELAWLL